MDRILPVLRPLSAPPGHRRLPPEKALVSRPIAGFLHELICTEDGQLRRFVRVDQLAEWGIDPRGARRVAWDQLVAADGLTVRDDGLWSLASGDGYEASRLLLPGFLQAFAGKVSGEPIAVVPHARLLLIGGSEDEAQITAMLHDAPRAWRSEADPISPVPYRLLDGNIVAWEPDSDADPVLRATVKATTVALASKEYASQAEDLDGDWATYEVGLAAEDGEIRQPYGFVRWKQGFTGSIPDCDVVVFCDGDDPVLAVPMDDVRQVLQLHWTKDLPRRYVVAGWPDRAAWSKLRDRALLPEMLG